MIIVESCLMVTMISEEIIFYLLVKSNPTRSFLSRPRCANQTILLAYSHFTSYISVWKEVFVFFSPLINVIAFLDSNILMFFSFSDSKHCC